jgi:hypothetical protein
MVTGLKNLFAFNDLVVASADISTLENPGRARRDNLGTRGLTAKNIYALFETGAI